MASLRGIKSLLLALGLAAAAAGLPVFACAQPLEPPAALADEPQPAVEDEAAVATPEQSAAIDGGLQTLFATPEPQVGPDVFGFTSVAVGETHLDNAWRLASGEAEPREAAVLGLAEELKGLPFAGRARAINVWVNHNVAYAEDIDVYGVTDHWAGLAETLAHGRGDCEDLAIAKMRLLEAAGVPARDMYLVLVRNVPRGADHAVLAVRDGESLYVLDSSQDGLVSPTGASPYRPVLGFGVDGRWVFGHRDEAATATAAGATTTAAAAISVAVDGGPVPFSR